MLGVGLQQAAGKPLSGSGACPAVVEEEVGGGTQHDVGHGEAFDDVSREELVETSPSAAEQLDQPFLEAEGLPTGLTPVFDQDRDVQIAAGGGAAGSSGAREDHAQGVGKPFCGEAPRPVDGVARMAGGIGASARDQQAGTPGTAGARGFPHASP